MKAEESSLSKLLQIEGTQWHYHVPKYQREYAWRKTNWEQLLEDLAEDPSDHYMGSIICIDEEEERNPSRELIYDVVDGQQRLTTISLLLMAIHYKLKEAELGEMEDEYFKENFANALRSVKLKLIKRLAPDSTERTSAVVRDAGHNYMTRVKPSEQDNNYSDYLFTLKEAGILSEIQIPKRYKLRAIYRAYKFFMDQLPSDVNALLLLLDKINKLEFVHISVKSQSKAFVLFETLNYRGVPLSAIDIIKNKMLATLEERNQMTLEDSFNKWQELLKYLPEDQDQNRFLRQYYNAFLYKQEVKIAGTRKATKSALIKIYEELIKRDSRWIFHELLEKAKTYNQFLLPDSETEEGLIESLLDLQRVGAVASYTFLLWLKSIPIRNWTSRTLFKDVVVLFEKYFVRRNVTDTPATRDIDDIMMSIIQECVDRIENNLQIDISFIRNSLINGKRKAATIEQFSYRLSSDLYESNADMARYLLARLDSISHHREYSPDLWQRSEKGELIWTIEHIFPKGERIPECWVQMIGNASIDEAKEIQKSYVHCLGNLTLSGYNSSLSNKCFGEKQGHHEVTVLGTKIFLGYQNGLALNKIPFKLDEKTFTLATIETWTEKSIIARNKRMVNDLLKLYSFEGEEDLTIRINES